MSSFFIRAIYKDSFQWWDYSWNFYYSVFDLVYLSYEKELLEMQNTLLSENIESLVILLEPHSRYRSPASKSFPPSMSVFVYQIVHRFRLIVCFLLSSFAIFASALLKSFVSISVWNPIKSSTILSRELVSYKNIQICYLK